MRSTVSTVTLLSRHDSALSASQPGHPRVTVAIGLWPTRKYDSPASAGTGSRGGGMTGLPPSSDSPPGTNGVVTGQPSVSLRSIPLSISSSTVHTMTCTRTISLGMARGAIGRSASWQAVPSFSMRKHSE